MKEENLPPFPIGKVLMILLLWLGALIASLIVGYTCKQVNQMHKAMVDQGWIKEAK